MDIEYCTPRSAGSDYVEILREDDDDIKVRFSNHSRQSRQHRLSDINVVSKAAINARWAGDTFSSAIATVLEQ